MGHALGGWSLGSFFQFYYGHLVDIWIFVTARGAVPAWDANGYPVLEQNGIPFNIGGDYNLDSELNDHPDFGGTNINSVYSGANPADGFFPRCGRVSWRSQACRPTSPTPPAVLALRAQ